MNDKNILKNQTKRSLWSEIGVYTYSRSIQEDSKIIQTHPTTLNLPKKAKKSGYMRLFSVNLRTYTTIQGKPACTRDCESKTCVQEEKEIKRRQTDKLRQNLLL